MPCPCSLVPPPAPHLTVHRPHAHPSPQVLRYFGWFGEPVPDSPLEAWRARKVCLLAYLQDDTMQVTEPPETNSGLQQVCREAVAGWGGWALVVEGASSSRSSQGGAGAYVLGTGICCFMKGLLLHIVTQPLPAAGTYQHIRLQGTLVRRHKLPKEGGGFLGIGDLAVGSSVKVYGR